MLTLPPARRSFLMLAAFAPLCVAGSLPRSTILRGPLKRNGVGNPAFQTANGAVAVTGDIPTGKILHDARLLSLEMEAKGHFTESGTFVIDPIETRSLLTFRAGQPFRITYFCDVCAIRTYSPGPCMCCQEETRVDLLDPNVPDL